MPALYATPNFVRATLIDCQNLIPKSHRQNLNSKKIMGKTMVVSNGRPKISRQNLTPRLVPVSLPLVNTLLHYTYE